MHVRLPRDRPRAVLLGRSQGGRELRAYRLGNPLSGRRVLVVGCIHGTECAGVAVARRVLLAPPPIRAELWVIPNLNPDGTALRVRQNGRGVDLNRNFPSEWRPIGHRWDPEYSGPKPLSEREARIAARLIERLRPRVTIWYHQPQGLVRRMSRSSWNFVTAAPV